MAVELVEPVKRVEQYLYALCVLDFSNIPVPRSRLEFFAHALITGVLPEFQAETREEVYITAIITGDYANLPLPKSRADQLLYKICLGETEIRDIELETRYEMLLAYIAEHGDMPLETVLVECVNALQTIPNTVEVPVKSAILTGQTLVNLMTKCKDEYVVRYNDINNPNNTVANISMMKPNTEYTLFYKAKYRTEGDGAGTLGFLKIGTSIEKGFIGTAQELTTEYEQYVYKFTTSSVVDCFVFATTVSYFAIKECVLLEGDYINVDIPYFTGMQSVKMPVLTTTGRNVLNPKRFVSTINTSSNDGVVININNQIEDLNFRSLYDELTLPVDTYTITCEVVNGTYLGGNLCIYDENNKNIREFAFKNGSGSTTITSSINKLRLWNAYGTDNCQIRVAITKDGSTTYEPYKTNILTVNDDVTLRGIGNVRDTLDCLTSEVVQNIGEIMLNGSNYDFSINNNTDTIHLIFNTRSLGIKKNGLCVCDKLPYKIGSEDMEHVRINADGNIVLWFNKSKFQEINKSFIQTYLFQNPVRVQYELAEKSIKTVVLTITDQDGNAMPCLSTFNDATYVSINAVDIIPQVDLEVRVDSNTMANVASQQENVAVAQASLSDAIDAQNDDITMTKQALDEVKGE